MSSAASAIGVNVIESKKLSLKVESRARAASLSGQRGELEGRELELRQLEGGQVVGAEDAAVGVHRPLGGLGGLGRVRRDVRVESALGLGHVRRDVRLIEGPEVAVELGWSL